MINGFLALMILFAVACIYYAFILPNDEKKLYKLYYLRDELALYAMKGLISQDSNEYIFLINLINTEIYYLKNDIPFSEMFASIWKYSDYSEDLLDDVIVNIKKDELTLKIFSEATTLFNKYYKFKGNCFIYLYVKPILFFLRAYIRYLKTWRNLTDKKRKDKSKGAIQYINNTNTMKSMLENIWLNSSGYSV